MKPDLLYTYLALTRLFSDESPTEEELKYQAARKAELEKQRNERREEIKCKRKRKRKQIDLS